MCEVQDPRGPRGMTGTDLSEKSKTPEWGFSPKIKMAALLLMPLLTCLNSFVRRSRNTVSLSGKYSPIPLHKIKNNKLICCVGSSILGSLMSDEIK